MRTPIITFVPLALGVVIVIGGLVTAWDSTRAAEDCLEQPNAQAPQGGHWYYHTDRATNRKCWVLRTDDGQVLQGAQDTTDGTNEDTTERQRAAHTPSQAASRPGSESTQPVPLRAPQSQAAQDSQRAQAPSAPASSAIEYNDPVFTPAWLRGDLMPTESAPSAASSPLVQPLRTMSIPTPQTPAPAAPANPGPANDDATGQITPVDTPQTAPQVVDEQKQEQIAPSSDDTKQEPTGGSAVTLLQKAFQRLTTPATLGTEHNHTLALMISALALLTIGAGVVAAARWSLYREKKRRRALQLQADAQNSAEPDLSAGRDLPDLGWREPQWTEHAVTEAKRVPDLPQREFLEPAAIQPDSGPGAVQYGLADRGGSQHDAAREMRDALTAHHHQASPPRGLTYREQPTEASHQPAPPAPEAAVSTQAVEQTLRRLLRELDAKRSDRPAPQTASAIPPDLPKAPATPDAYGAKRRHRGRMRLA